MKGKRVLVRAGSAGVHFGTLESFSGQQVHLKNSRRLWKWGDKALSLHEVSIGHGLKLSACQISEPVDEIIITTAIEIIPISKSCILPI